MTLSLMFTGSPKSDVMEQDAVFPDMGRLTDYNAGAVVDKKARAYRCSRMDFQPGQKSAYLGKKTGNKRYVNII